MAKSTWTFKPKQQPPNRSNLLTAKVKWEQTREFWTRDQRKNANRAALFGLCLVPLSMGVFTGSLSSGNVLVFLGLSAAILMVGSYYLLKMWARVRRIAYAELGLQIPKWKRSVLLGQVHTWREEGEHFRMIRQQWEGVCKAPKVKLVYEDARYLGRRVQIAPSLYNMQMTPAGDVNAELRFGKMFINFEDIAKRRTQLAAAVEAREFRIHLTSPGRAKVSWLWSDALERVLPVNELPHPGKTGHGAFGIYADSRPATIDLKISTLCVGVQGSGKSSLGWALISDILRTGEYVDLYVVDPKVGAEWGWLRRLTDTSKRVRIREFAKTDNEAREMLKTKVLPRIRARLHDQGGDDDDLTKNPVRQHIPTAAEPRIIVLADELLHLRNTISGTPKDPSPMGQIVSIGRSVCAAVWAFSQDGTKEVIGPIRDLFGQRICMRTASPDMTNVVLLDKAEAVHGAKCSEIPLDQPGLGYYYDNEIGSLQKVRVAYVSDDMIERYIQHGVAPAGMPAKGELPGHSRKVNVYAFYQNVDNLYRKCLYVGKGYFDDRRKDHAGLAGNPAKPWWHLVDERYTELAEVDTDPEALALESVWIEEKKPLWNDQQNRGNPMRRHEGFVELPEMPQPKSRLRSVKIERSDDPSADATYRRRGRAARLQPFRDRFGNQRTFTPANPAEREPASVGATSEPTIEDWVRPPVNGKDI